MIKNHTIAILFVFILATLTAYGQTSEDMLNEFQWKKRPVLVFAASQDTPAYQQQQKIWDDAKEGLRDRDIIIIRIFSDRVEGADLPQQEAAQRLRATYGVEDSAFTVVLVGKDGGEKLRRDRVLTREELFAVIDAMPMRKREMKRNQ